MNKSYLHFDFLISCPSDIKKEVEVIKSVINKFNDTEGRSKSIYIQYKHWSSHSYPEYNLGTGSAQELLNRQIVNNCDGVIAVFWSRFGSPTDKFDSGTEEEIEQMIKDRKHIMLYFSDKKLMPSQINTEQYEKVKIFKNKYAAKGLYCSYKTIKEFEEKFKEHIYLYFSNIDNHVVENDGFQVANNNNHECTYKQLAKRLIELILNKDYLSVKNIFKGSLTHEVARHFKSYLVKLDYNSKEKCQLFFEKIYAMATDDEFIREQCCYYMSYLNVKTTYVFLTKILSIDTSQLVTRGAYIGLLLHTNDQKYLIDYILLLKKNPFAAAINAGYHQCHYGDKFQNEGYEYNNFLDNTMSINGLMKHFRKDNYNIIIPIDLFTIQYMIYYSSISTLQKYQLETINKYIDENDNVSDAINIAKREFKEWMHNIVTFNDINYFVKSGFYIKKLSSRTEQMKIYQNYISSVYIDNDFYYGVNERADIYGYDDLIRNDIQKFENLVDEIMNYDGFKNKETLDVLDMGCGYGAFLSVWRSKKIGNAYGVDLSEEAIKLSIRLYGKDNKIEVSDALNVDKSINKYRPNIICCFDFIEHLFNVELFFFNIKESMPRDTYLVIYLPIIENNTQVAELTNYRYHYPDHIFYFTFDGIVSVANNNDYNLVYNKQIRKNKTLFIFQKQ